MQGAERLTKWKETEQLTENEEKSLNEWCRLQNNKNGESEKFHANFANEVRLFLLSEFS